MRVADYQVPDDALAKACQEMGRAPQFRMLDVVTWLREAGVSPKHADRAADKLLQRERRAGLIRFHKGWWQRCGVRQSN